MNNLSWAALGALIVLTFPLGVLVVPTMRQKRKFDEAFRHG
jgi:hypothetical protein